MDFNLTIPFEDDLTSEEKTAIDEYIDKTYEEHKNNSKELTKLAMQASASISAGKARAEKLANQGFLKNLWGGITGKNRQIRGEIDRDFAVSQRANVKMISKLAEQNKLTFDAIVGISVKLNSLSNQIDNEFNEVYSQINKIIEFFKNYLSEESKKINQLVSEESKRINQLERKINGLEKITDGLEISRNIEYLKSNIEYAKFDEILYKDLPDNEKILCIVSDFFLATKGNYSMKDIDLLKSIMGKVGINPEDKISMLSLYETLISNDKIAGKLFEAIDEAKFKSLDDIEIPLLGSLKKLKLLENEEKYIVDSVIEISKAPEQDVQFNLLKNYAKNNLNMDLEKDNSYFDLSVAIINELSNIDNVEKFNIIKKISASAQTYYCIALELFDEENFEGSLFLLKKALENGMDNSEIYESLAKISLYIGEEEFDELPNYYKLAIERGAATYENYYKFGMALFIKLNYEEQEEQNNYEEVIKALEKAIELSDKSVYIYINLGVIYRMLENYDKAVEYYDKAIELEKDNALAYYNKAEALDKSGEKKTLVEDTLDKAIAFSRKYKKELKTKAGTLFKDFSKRLKCEFSLSSETEIKEFDELLKTFNG